MDQFALYESLDEATRKRYKKIAKKNILEDRKKQREERRQRWDDEEKMRKYCWIVSAFCIGIIILFLGICSFVSQDPILLSGAITAIFSVVGLVGFFTCFMGSLAHYG